MGLLYSIQVYTRLLLPQVRTKVTFPHDRDTGVSYCRMLLNDTLLNEDSIKNGLRESPMCDCNKERETVSALLAVRITRKSGISCKMLLMTFGLLWSVKVTCNCQTIFFLHLHKLIASQKEWTEILNLHFFNPSDQLIERFDPILPSSWWWVMTYIYYILVKTVTNHYCCHKTSFWFYKMFTEFTEATIDGNGISEHRLTPI